jgi:hypothetical protein
MAKESHNGKYRVYLCGLLRGTEEGREHILTGFSGHGAGFQFVVEIEKNLNKQQAAHLWLESRVPTKRKSEEDQQKDKNFITGLIQESKQVVETEYREEIEL